MIAQSSSAVRRLVCVVALALTTIGVSATAHAQAWLPPKGEGSISLTYAHFEGGDHLFSTDAIDGLTSRGYKAEGKRWFLGNAYSHNLQLELDYAFVDRLALTAGLGFVRAKYEGNAPVNPAIDNGFYHSGIQDFDLQLRAVAMNRSVVITPFVAYSAPLKTYENSGHSALGRGLYELRSGVFLAWVPARFVPGSYAQARLSYGWSERADDRRVRRGVFDVEIGYFVSERLSVRALSVYQRTYGGHEWVSGDPTQPSGHGGAGGGVGLDIATSAARYARLGFGASYSVIQDVGISVSYVTTAWGENVDDADFLVAGITYNFRTPWSEYRQARK